MASCMHQPGDLQGWSRAAGRNTGVEGFVQLNDSNYIMQSATQGACSATLSARF